MRRIDIINSFEKLTEAFNLTSLEHFFLISADKMDPGQVLEGFRLYNQFYQTFNDTDKQLLQIFNLDGMESNVLWSKLIMSDKEHRDVMRNYAMSLRYFRTYLPNIVSMLRQDHVQYRENAGSVVQESSLENSSLLTVILPESKNEISNPERLIKILESINNLYRALSTLNNYHENDLSVAAIDSGSDKSFDFTGASKIINALKELIFGVWDRIVFHRENKAGQRLELVLKSLPILDNIGEMEKKETISKEQAELLRRNISSGIESFINAGAILPEFQNHIRVNPRELMAPAPKLLNSSNEQSDGNLPDEGTEVIGPDPLKNLTEEEIQVLKRMFNKT